MAADPIVQFRAWWEEARATGAAWSDAMVLATSSPAGGPSARAVILRGLDERGFVFFTDTRSAKAVELETDPRVALVVLWSALQRQVPAHAVDVAGFRTFRQVAFLGTFEGQPTLGLGVRARVPFRVFVLSGPAEGSRVVIDVAHRW